MAPVKFLPVFFEYEGHRAGPSLMLKAAVVDDGTVLPVLFVNVRFRPNGVGASIKCTRWLSLDGPDP